MANIVLIGMPACGKSTIGVVLAKTINKGFIDMDLVIQQREKKTLQQIIDEKGNEYFRKVEEEVLTSFEGSDFVVATGGSAIYYEKAMEHFKKNGKVLYLHVGFNTMIERLSNIKTRGVSRAKGQTLEDLYKERTPLYEKYADIIIEEEGLSLEEIVEEIIRKIGELDD